MTATRVEDDPAVLAELFESDREVHLYGLADLEDPFWSASTWYREGSAAVGLVSTGEDWTTGYAMSRSAPSESLRLLGEVHDQLPPGSWVTGPIGMANALEPVRGMKPKGPHWRMILDITVPDQDTSRAVPLELADIEALEDLHSTDPDAAFFMSSMLIDGHFVGIWDAGQLVASAGTHVTSHRYGVAALGAVITRPSHRAQGLARVVVSALSSLLIDRYRTVGLNVSDSNPGALRLYESLGFRRELRYEEVQLH